MCDFNKFSAFVIAAQIAFIGMIGVLVAAAINANSIFTMVLNIPLMCVAIGLSLSAGILFGLALTEVNLCTGPCDRFLANVMHDLKWLISTCSVLTASIAAATFVAFIPGLGTATISAVVFWCVVGSGLMTTITAMASQSLATAFVNFNNCQAANGRPNNPTLATVVTVLGYIGGTAGILAGLVFGIVLFPLAAMLILSLTGVFPLKITINGSTFDPPVK